MAVFVTTCWLGALLALAATTANPVTVNRSQLLAADAVVVARADLATVRDDTVSIDVGQILAGRDLPPSLRIIDAETGRFQKGSRYLIPLQKSADGYAVTPVPKLKLEATPRGLVLVPFDDGEGRTAVFYPATEDVLRATERILTTEAAKPYP
ncbi:MAG: hypothetical protein WBC44_17085 [Planctomycetaceae bacterium]